MSPNPTSVALIAIAQIIGGHVEPSNVDDVVRFGSGEDMDKEGTNDRLYAALLVMGEEDEITDFTGLTWTLPHGAYDTPKGSNLWAEHCVKVIKLVVELSSPRKAIRDATVIMELELCAVDALCSY